MGHLTRIADRIAALRRSSPTLDALVSQNEAWEEWQGTGLKRRNALENVHNWSCGYVPQTHTSVLLGPFGPFWFLLVTGVGLLTGVVMLKGGALTCCFHTQ